MSSVAGLAPTLRCRLSHPLRRFLPGAVMAFNEMTITISIERSDKCVLSRQTTVFKRFVTFLFSDTIHEIRPRIMFPFAFHSLREKNNKKRLKKMIECHEASGGKQF